MNERVVPKMINFCVVKLSNSLAITCVPRLELDHFESQPDSPRINQRFPRQPGIYLQVTPGYIYGIIAPVNQAYKMPHESNR